MLGRLSEGDRFQIEFTSFEGERVCGTATLTSTSELPQPGGRLTLRGHHFELSSPDREFGDFPLGIIRAQGEGGNLVGFKAESSFHRGTVKFGEKIIVPGFMLVDSTI